MNPLAHFKKIDLIDELVVGNKYLLYFPDDVNLLSNDWRVGVWDSWQEDGLVFDLDEGYCAKFDECGLIYALPSLPQIKSTAIDLSV